MKDAHTVFWAAQVSCFTEARDTMNKIRENFRENFLAVLIVTGLIDYPEDCEKTLLKIGRK